MKDQVVYITEDEVRRIIFNNIYENRQGTRVTTDYEMITKLINKHVDWKVKRNDNG